jgi:hypothetical protein
MLEEIDLYFFDDSLEAAGRLATLRQLFDNGRWTVLQWPDASASPHFNMLVRFMDPGPISPALPPAMTTLSQSH